MKSPNHRKALALVYVMVVLIVMMMCASLAVDVGRAQLAKTQLQQAADAASRYGAAGLSQGVTAVQNRVIASGAENRVDGSSISFSTSNDIEFGVWDPTNKSFATLTGSERSSATALRVTARRTAATGNAVPTLFASVLGRRTVDVRASATASRGLVIAPAVQADSCPWLAGMPNGSQVAGYGGNSTPATAPNNSPLQITSLPFSAGTKLAFRDSSGTTSYGSSDESYGPDGQTDWIVQQNPANGINSTAAPLNCLVGIFLDDRAPNTYSQAASLNFSTSDSRNFTSLSPALKQVFFIGDGLTSSGTLQEFVVPSGATRFYLGIMDEKGWWWDNTGTLNTTMMNDRVTLVK